MCCVGSVKVQIETVKSKINVVCCVGSVEIQIEIEKGWCTAYSTITLRARNFYEVIVNKGEVQVNYRFIEIESE